MENFRDLLRLSSVPRIGSQKLRFLVNHFGDPLSVLKASALDLIKVNGIDRKLASNILHHDGNGFADDQLKRLERTNGRIITCWDKEYPDLLGKIYDAPAILFLLGKLSDIDQSSIAIVGTRNPSQYGRSTAAKLTRELATMGITTVSGMARGIDTIVHTTSLKSEGRTIAVIGSGLDVPYPPENRKLMYQIAESGAVVSEFPMGTKPDATNFPRRNRIISGLSLGTVIVESARDGGAMITANTALDQDREVFAIPGNISEKKSSGPNTLIKEGRAKLTISVEDILEEIRFRFNREDLRKIVPQKAPEVNLFEDRILKLLSENPIHIDAISEEGNLSSADTLVHLLSLEFKGLVRQLPGKYFILT